MIRLIGGNITLGTMH